MNENPDPDGLQSRILPAVPEIPDDFDKWNHLKVSIDKPLKYLDTINYRNVG